MSQFFNLQLFAEEAVSQPATGTAEPTGTEGTADAGTEAVAPQGEDQPISFDEMVEGNPEYKKALGKHVQDAINKRFKNQQDNQELLDSLNPMLGVLAERFEVARKDDGSIDYEALNQKIMDDNSMYEEEAFKRGMTVEDLKHMKQLERENETLTRQAQARAKEDETTAAFNELLEQAAKLEGIYPNFNLNDEMENPDFGRLIALDVPVQTAYEVVHKDEILASGMQYAVEQTKKNISNSIQSGKRPAENGMGSQGASDPGRVNISKLTKKDFADIKARAESGERITF